VASLCWQDEAGGFTFSREDALAMDLDEMDRYIAIANERRQARERAIKRAYERT